MPFLVSALFSVKVREFCKLGFSGSQLPVAAEVVMARVIVAFSGSAVPGSWCGPPAPMCPHTSQFSLEPTAVLSRKTG